MIDSTFISFPDREARKTLSRVDKAFCMSQKGEVKKRVEREKENAGRQKPRNSIHLYLHLFTTELHTN